MQKITAFTLILLFAYILFLTAACKDPCEDVRTGQVELRSEISDWLPYTDGETIRFFDNAGDTLSFVNEYVEEPYRICITKKCETTTGPFEPTPCDYYDTRGYRNVLQSGDSLTVDMLLAVEQYEAESTLFYDYFALNFGAISPIARAQTAPEVHFATPAFDVEKSIIQQPFEQVDTVEINGRLYTDVLKTPTELGILWFEPGGGILGFRYSGVTYGTL